MKKEVEDTAKQVFKSKDKDFRPFIKYIKMSFNCGLIRKLQV